MRTGIPASALLLLSLASCLYPANNASSAQPIGQQMPELAQYIVPRGEQFSIENFTFQNATAYAATSDSGTYAIFSKNATGGVSPVTDPGQIQLYLSAFYLSAGYDPLALKNLAMVHTGLSGIEGNRKSGEAECFRLMGMEGRPCNGDFELCKAYCIGTPFCNNFAYGGELGEFIRVIIEFENNTRNLDSAYRNESLAYSAVAANSTQDSVSSYLSAIGAINRAATKVSSSSLFYGYSFCFTPDYSLPSITTLQLSAQNAYRQNSPFLLLPMNAELIRNRTLEGMAAKAKFESALEAARQAAERQRKEAEQNLSSRLNAEKNDSKAIAPPAPRQPVSTELLAIAAAAVGLALLGILAYFAMKQHKAKGRKASEAFQKAEEDLGKKKR